MIGNRHGEELSSQNPVGNYDPQLQPPFLHEGVQHTFPEVSIHTSDPKATSATLPPSFTTLLSGWSIEAAQVTLTTNYANMEQVVLTDFIIQHF